MTQPTEDTLRARLLRDDGQEDLCLATYRPSTGATRATAVLRQVLPPEPGERAVHGTVTVTAEYVLRAIKAAQENDSGVVLLHSHPGGTAWQGMSDPDWDSEWSFANLARELTGLPLVGMTLAGRDGTWSARHWDTGVGSRVRPTHARQVRVVGNRFVVSWNDAEAPRPALTEDLSCTTSAWGEDVQADLARRRVLVVGAGSVGLDVATRLAASGVQELSVMDFDLVEVRNRDRLLGATRRDVHLRRPKIHIARRETTRNATAARFTVHVVHHSICEPAGLAFALDHDLIFSCVDRPWARAVLNALAYTDLIPVIDGGLAIDTIAGEQMRGATWRSHVVRPGRPCMVCTKQLNPADVALDIQGLLDDASYIGDAELTERESHGQNVAVLSVSVTAALLAQYTSFSVAPGGFGEPGPLQYLLGPHHVDHLLAQTGQHCAYEAEEGVGDSRPGLTGHHKIAEERRWQSRRVPPLIRLARRLDDGCSLINAAFDRAPRQSVTATGLADGIRRHKLLWRSSSSP